MGEALEAYLRAHPGSESTRLVVEEGMRASLTCPLVAMGKPVGFLFFSSRTPGAYAAAHVETFVALSGQLSLIVEKGRLYEQILHEQARSERLLLNVLPELIALRLKGGAEVIAEQAAEATVLFLDVAGFSSLALKAVPSLPHTYDPGRTPVYLGFGLLTLSLCMVFFYSHQRVWAVVEPDGKHTRIYFGGNTNRNRPAFEARFNSLVQSVAGGSEQ